MVEKQLGEICLIYTLCRTERELGGALGVGWGEEGVCAETGRRETDGAGAAVPSLQTRSLHYPVHWEGRPRAALSLTLHTPSANQNPVNLTSWGTGRYDKKIVKSYFQVFSSEAIPKGHHFLVRFHNFENNLFRTTALFFLS